MRTASNFWKFTLTILAILVVIGSIVSTEYLARQLANEERKGVELWLAAQNYIIGLSDEEAQICDISLHGQILNKNTTTPMILVGSDGKVISGKNFSNKKDEDLAYLNTIVEELREEGFTPVVGNDTQIFFLESNLLIILKYFPFIQLALISTFILLGYFLIRSARHAEQNRIWVGMAKETAHQLGTPISAIMAWIEFLRDEYEDNPELIDVAEELGKDVNRLQLVADRFNKIGSTPVTTPTTVHEALEEVVSYMKKRTPRKMTVKETISPEVGETKIKVNKHLFQWVIENLIRNAMDAMDGKGQLTIAAINQPKHIEILISDTGKGIPANKRKTVFKPGYTTKSRGWGLGLSLAKRIIEVYHDGKIFVKDSVVGEGTTFAIRISKA